MFLGEENMVYIDEILILNFIIDYILLLTTSKILKIQTKKYKLLLSCLLGELSLITLFISLNNITLLIIKLITCALMILISFGYNDIKTFIKNIIYFYIINFFLGGTLYYFKIEALIKYEYYLLLIPLIIHIYWYFTYNLKNIFSLKYKVTVYLNNGKILYLNGFMDTGNNLIEPYNNRKVIIINKKINENFYLVPYKTIDNSSLIKCFNPKKVYIDGIGERNDISIGIINKKFIGYNCLLNYKLLED